MKIREINAIGGPSRFTADAAEDTLRELEAQYANGEIERHAYFQKKRSLVRQFVKATTGQRRIDGT